MKEVPIRIDHIEDSFNDREVLEAMRNRLEQTAEWLEHKRWHEEDLEHRGRAVLVTNRDEPETVSIETPLRADLEDAPVKKQRHTAWAGCTCKSPTIKLIFGDDGGIENELPQQVEMNSYGVAAADEAVTYLGNNPASGSPEYRSSEPAPAVQYSPSPLVHSTYK